jgi:hypothetical protein
VFEEGGAAPSLFDWNLREKESAAVSLFDNQPVAADLDVIHRSKLLLRRQHRDLDIESVELGRGDWVEPRVGISDDRGKMNNGFTQPLWLETPETPA